MSWSHQPVQSRAKCNCSQLMPSREGLKIIVCLNQEYRIDSDKVPVLPAPRSLEDLITTTLTRLPAASLFPSNMSGSSLRHHQKQMLMPCFLYSLQNSDTPVPHLPSAISKSFLRPHQKLDRCWCRACTACRTRSQINLFSL
ncbi:uncharacterized protein LOC114680180 [Macaca mulatta]